jgi:hypothetical protein
VKELSCKEPETVLQAKEELSKGRGETTIVDFNKLETDLGEMNHRQ